MRASFLCKTRPSWLRSPCLVEMAWSRLELHLDYLLLMFKLIEQFKVVWENCLWVWCSWSWTVVSRTTFSRNFHNWSINGFTVIILCFFPIVVWNRLDFTFICLICNTLTMMIVIVSLLELTRKRLQLSGWLVCSLSTYALFLRRDLNWNAFVYYNFITIYWCAYAYFNANQLLLLVVLELDLWYSCRTFAELCIVVICIAWWMMDCMHIYIPIFSK